MGEFMHRRSIHDFDAEALRRLNSATQYPSIPTYHVLGEKGRLTEDRNADFSAADDVEVTEKIDGTNTRLVVPPAGVGNVLIGSRTELLHHHGDVIANPAQDIVETVLPWVGTARRLCSDDPNGYWVVLFGEVYGGKVTAGSKNYTTSRDARGFRLFDVCQFPPDVLDWQRDRIAAWRDGGGQEFDRTDLLARIATEVEAPLVPSLEHAGPLPTSVTDTHKWLGEVVTKTLAALDESALARPEGVVVRTADRSQIVKIRFEDYERTAKARR